MKVLAAVATLVIALSGPVAAQQGGLPPLVKDIDPKKALPADGTFDTAGIALGMTQAEVEAAFKTLDPKGKIELGAKPQSLKDDRGNSAAFEYVARLSLQSGAGNKYSDTIDAIFATGHTGGRVVALDRTISYESEAEMPYRPALLQALLKKYGPVSYEARESGEYVLVWAWVRGRRVSFAEGDPRRRQPPPAADAGDGASKTCLEQVSRNWEYDYQPDREDPAPGCTAVIAVRVATPPGKDLAAEIAIRMVDKSSGFEGLIVADRWLAEELMRKAPRAMPKL